jgi:hypothetical protein
MNYLAKSIKYDEEQLREKIKIIMMEKECGAAHLSRLMRISVLTLRDFLCEKRPLRYVTFIKVYKYVIAYEELNSKK